MPRLRVTAAAGLVLCLAGGVAFAQLPPVPQGDDFLVAEQEFGGFVVSQAMDDEGNLVLIWHEGFSGFRGVGYSASGERSALPLPCCKTTNCSSDFLDVTSIARDEFVAAWDGFGPSGCSIWSQRYSVSGAALGPVFELVGPEIDLAKHPALAPWSLGSGMTLAVWAAIDSAGDDHDGTGIQAQIFDTSGSQGSLLQINAFTLGDQLYPEVSVVDEVGITIVWQSDQSDGPDSSGTSIQGRSLTFHGSPGPQFEVNTHTSGDQRNPDVAMQADGRFLVVWDGESSESDLDRSVQARLFDSDGSPSGADFQVNSWTTGPQFGARVAVLPDSRFLVTWRSQHAVAGQIVAGDGSLLGEELELNTTASGFYRDPGFGSNKRGQFVVSWFGDGYYQTDLRARVFRTGLFVDGFESGDTSAWGATVP